MTISPEEIARLRETCATSAKSPHECSSMMDPQLAREALAQAAPRLLDHIEAQDKRSADLGGEVEALKHDIERHLHIVGDLEAELKPLREAAQEFVAKVDRGEARSVRSYAAFKAALAERAKEDGR